MCGSAWCVFFSPPRVLLKTHHCSLSPLWGIIVTLTPTAPKKKNKTKQELCFIPCDQVIVEVLISDQFFSFQLQYGEPVIRRAVPLALAILSASNPQLSIVDTLSKLSHDNDAEVSHNSIFAMGIVGAGQYSMRL